MQSLLRIDDTRLDPYSPYRSLLSHDRVRELSKLRPWRPVFDALCCWAWIVGAWTAVALWPTWWTVLLAIPIIGVRYYTLLIIGHDGIHRRLFRSARWNDWFADVVVFGPVAGITRINNQNHLGHHRLLSTPEDPDLHQFTCTNKYRLWLLLGYLSGVTSLHRSFKNVFLRRESSRPKTVKHSPGYTWRDLAVIALWQAGLIGGLTWFVAWWAYPVLWLAPLYCITFLLENFRGFAEHSQPEPDAQADQHRLITFLSNPVERWFVAPLNMNYHAAHHLWPSIPYYNLPRADEEIRGQPGCEGLQWRGTYLGYLFRYFGVLPLTDCRPNAV
jgi:fatty acid desaturase